ncbi:hypothetical protein TrRE_jg5631 [Triparma retinervis]|uniref:MULE transposase domain-containing protein n=1 Tax=Triparma retinervis TaxID=2557542 RepID=A0A9W7ALJ4_9STRA|nr:hypothetical protein TrRE_jg5631 [Triparma retinervis]
MDAFMEKVVAAAATRDYTLTASDFGVLLNATTHEERTAALRQIDGLELDEALLAEISALPLSSETSSNGNAIPNTTSSAGGGSEAVVAGELALAEIKREVQLILPPHKFTGSTTSDPRQDLSFAVRRIGTMQGQHFKQLKGGGGGGGSKIVFACDCSNCNTKIVARKLGVTGGGGYWMLHKDTKVEDFMKSTRCTSKAKISTLELVPMIGADIQSNPSISAKIGLRLAEQRGAPETKAKSIYNAKAHMKKLDLNTYPSDFSRMAEYFEKFVAKNPGSVAKVFTTDHSYGTYTQKHFTKGFVVFKACVDIIRKVGLPTHYLDGTFSKHDIYNGVYLFLVGRDSNNKILLLAIMICETEDGASYSKFADELAAADCGDIFGDAQAGGEEEAAYVHSALFNGERPVIFGDRGKGMNKFFDGFFASRKLLRLWCCWHLRLNCNDQANKGEGLTTGDFWGLQGSESVEEFEKKRKILKNTHPSAINYLDKFERSEWVCYAIIEKNDVSLHNHSTNGCVESCNGAVKEYRRLAPLQFLQNIFLYISKQIQSRHREAEKLLALPEDKRPLFTKYFNTIIGGQTARTNQYSSATMGPDSGYITFKGDIEKAHTVELKKKYPCSNCNFRQNNGIDCAHTLKFLSSSSSGEGLSLEDYSKSDRCPKYALLKNYADAYKNAAVFVPVLQDIKAKDIGLKILEDGTAVPVDVSAILAPLHRRPVAPGPKRKKPYPSRGLGVTTTSTLTASSTIAKGHAGRPRRPGAGTNRHREGGQGGR